jgi:hypothetical protein
MKSQGLFRLNLIIALSLWGCTEATEVPDDSTSVSTQPSGSVQSAQQGDWFVLGNLTAVNSAAMEQHPTLSKDGLSLYFASNRTEDPAVTADQNIWVARRDCADGCAWGEPVMLGDSVNSGSLDAAPALSRDGHQLFFASQRGGEGPRWSGDACAAAPCDRDLWVSYREDVQDDFAWQPAVNLGPPVNTNGEEVAPAYFENDDIGLPQLFFNDGVLNTAGVLVLGNIYMTQLNSDGTWSPRSAPSKINTDCSDQRPSISHDGRTLYFHSTRPVTPPGPCATQARIWVATREEVTDPWSAPTLVPSPISDVQTIHPFIHSHGRIETLFFVRSGDIWISQRTRANASEPAP